MRNGKWEMTEWEMGDAYLKALSDRAHCDDEEPGL